MPPIDFVAVPPRVYVQFNAYDSYARNFIVILFTCGMVLCVSMSLSWYQADQARYWGEPESATVVDIDTSYSSPIYKIDYTAEDGSTRSTFTAMEDELTIGSTVLAWTSEDGDVFVGGSVMGFGNKPEPGLIDLFVSTREPLIVVGVGIALMLLALRSMRKYAAPVYKALDPQPRKKAPGH